MYESFFGLVKRPFASAPDADCYFPGQAIENARQTLYRCLERGEGAGLLIGPAGTGKTLLLEALAEQFSARFEVAVLASGRLCTRRAMLQAILFELGLPYRDLEEGELRLSLIDHLSDTSSDKEGLILLIDEAHTLPLRLLEEIRLLTNLVRNGQPKVRLVLAGSAALEERFTSPKLEAFNQRVTARCYLQAFDRSETREYIRAQVEWAGGEPDRIFTAGALEAIHRATDGIPRLVNQVCDHALILACAAGVEALDKPQIEEAWADLQQLPTPWNRVEGAAPLEKQGEVIEFGVLDDEPVETSLAERPPTPKSPVNISPVIEIDDFSDRELDLDFDEPAAVPFPRPSGQDDAAPAFSRDPVRRLQEVERSLAAIDGIEDFEPARARGPEVELTFGATTDPFGEPFADEEIVIDPYSSSMADALANRPVVRSDEGRALGAVLKPLSSRPPKLAIAREVLDSAAKTRPPRRDAGAIRPENPPAAFDAVIEIVASDDASPIIEVNEADERSVGAQPTEQADQPTLPMLATPSDGTEPELIVIEDEPVGMRKVNVVRRQQYRQLFANLRRG